MHNFHLDLSFEEKLGENVFETDKTLSPKILALI